MAGPRLRSKALNPRVNCMKARQTTSSIWFTFEASGQVMRLEAHDLSTAEAWLSRWLSRCHHHAPLAGDPFLGKSFPFASFLHTAPASELPLGTSSPFSSPVIRPLPVPHAVRRDALHQPYPGAAPRHGSAGLSGGAFKMRKLSAPESRVPVRSDSLAKARLRNADPGSPGVPLKPRHTPQLSTLRSVRINAPSVEILHSSGGLIKCLPPLCNTAHPISERSPRPPRQLSKR